jgi:hypothetical protein
VVRHAVSIPKKKCIPLPDSARRSNSEREENTYRKILNIWSISESPGNNGAPRIAISAKMQPTLHMSSAVL